MSEQSAILRGALVGAVAGAVGTFFMNHAHRAWSRIEEHVPLPDDEEEDGNGEDESEDPATVKAAAKISEGVLDYELDDDQKQVAGQVMHWAMGITSGSVYGVITTAAPVAGIGYGIPFGAALWAVADEIAVPFAGLSDSPRDVPASTHVEALFAHLIYGVVTDLTRRAIVGLME